MLKSGRPPKYRITSGFFENTKIWGCAEGPGKKFGGGGGAKNSGVAPKAQVKSSVVAPKAQGKVRRFRAEGAMKKFGGFAPKAR